MFLVISKFDSDVFIFPKRGFRIAILPIFRCPYKHIAFSGRKKRLSILIRIFRSSSVKLCIIVDFEVYSCIRNGLALFVNNLKINSSRTAIIINEIDFCKVVSAQHHFFRTSIITKCTCVHQHCTGCRSIKPR